MNVKGISIIVGVFAVILLVVLLPIKPGDVPPVIQDTPELGEGVDIGLGDKDTPELGEGAVTELSNEDVPTTTDSVTVTSETTPDFYFDENGTKHYVIDATDVVIPQN